MANMTLGLDSATIVIQIRQNRYELNAPKQEISFDDTPGIPKQLRFRYKKPYELAIDIGTLRELLEEIQSLLAAAPLPAGTPPFLTQWQTIETTLSGAPVLGPAIENVLDTDVRVTEIEIALTRVDDQKYKGKFVLGVIFTPATPPRIFNIQVLQVGTVVRVELEGDLSELNFDW